jgi:hypothetical protein
VRVRHRAEQFVQHVHELVVTLLRLFEDVGEDAVGQQLDILGEQAEDELVDEMRDAALVVMPRA